MPTAFEESELLPLSGLQHLAFCERQCALIHVERIWRDDGRTAEGRDFHQTVDRGRSEQRRKTRTVRGMALRNLRLGLTGKSDTIELIADSRGTAVPGLGGRWRLYPVEHKVGRAKTADWDRVQLCAQALCLEEMFDTVVSTGALFYGTPRRREEVRIDSALRSRTEQLAARFHQIVDSRETPRAERRPKCRRCSLLPDCMPAPARRPRSVARYVRRSIEDEVG